MLKPNEDLIKAMELLLDLAKSGELRGIAFACELSESRIETGWSDVDGSAFRFIGAIRVLEQRVIESFASPWCDRDYSLIE